MVRIFAALFVAGLAAGPQGASAQQTPPPSGSSATVCPEVEMPVCATKDGRRVRYGNDCKARRDGATDITPGECPASR